MMTETKAPAADPGAARRAMGEATRRSVLGDAHVDRSQGTATLFDKPFVDFITEGAWGTVWSGDQLTKRERSLITLALLAGVDPAIPVDRMWSERRADRYKATLDFKMDYPRWNRQDTVEAIAEVFTVTDLDRKVMASIYDSGLVQVAHAMDGPFHRDSAFRLIDGMNNARPEKFGTKEYDETHRITLVGAKIAVNPDDDAKMFVAPTFLNHVEGFYDSDEGEDDPQVAQNAVAEYGAVWDAWHAKQPDDGAAVQPRPAKSFKILTTAAFHDLRPSRRAAMDLAVLLVGYACQTTLSEMSPQELYGCVDHKLELAKRGFGSTKLDLGQLAEYPVDEDVPDSFSSEERELLLGVQAVGAHAALHQHLPQLGGVHHVDLVGRRHRRVAKVGDAERRAGGGGSRPTT